MVDVIMMGDVMFKAPPRCLVTIVVITTRATTTELLLFPSPSETLKWKCCNPNLGFATKARACEGAGQE